jgi:hypothetical protein
LTKHAITLFEELAGRVISVWPENSSTMSV